MGFNQNRYIWLKTNISHVKRESHIRAATALDERLLKKQINESGDTMSKGRREDSNDLLFETHPETRTSIVQGKLDKKLAEVKKAFGDVCKFDNGEIVCSYCSARFVAFPQHRNVTNNIGTHVNTIDHKNDVSKRKIQKSM